MRYLLVTFGVVLSLLTNPNVASSSNWKAGVAKIDITPTESLRMAGYSSRTKPSTGSVHPLWAKALVIADGNGQRCVVVTIDLIGDNFGRKQFDRIASDILKATGIQRNRMVFNASHTHCGPIERNCDGVRVTYALERDQQQATDRFTKQFGKKIADVVIQAAANLQPVRLDYSEGQAVFGTNRRKAINPDGPSDHAVPVLRICNAQDETLAILFGYACHNTTLGGDFLKYCGDFAGFAQIALENEHPGATAMFLSGCGADINPAPRGTLELAQQHGQTLAEAVEAAMTNRHCTVQGELKSVMRRIPVKLVAPPSLDDLRAKVGQGNRYEQRLTNVLIERLENGGSLAETYPCPVQVFSFGDDWTLVTIGGEVVVDYSLRIRREFPNRNIWVAGYSNEVFAYVPSERILAEGGYEGGGAMKYFGLHGPFQTGIESTIINAVKQMVNQLDQ